MVVLTVRCFFPRIVAEINPPYDRIRTIKSWEGFGGAPILRPVSNALQRLFAQQLRERRRAAGLSQADLAERSGVSTEFVSRMERGVTFPSVPTLMSLCRALACTPNDLLLAPQRRNEDAIDRLRDRLSQVPSPVARDAIRVAEALVEYSKIRKKP